MFSTASSFRIVKGQECVLTFLQTSPCFYVSVVQVFQKHCEKREIAHNEQFLLSHSVSYPFKELIAFFIKLKIVVCKIFQFGRVKKLSTQMGQSRLK